MRERGLVIAIDGPAAAGKTTAARNLARRLGYLYLDTGATFRAVALKALRIGQDLGDPEAIERIAASSEIRFSAAFQEKITLDGEDVTGAIRTREVSEAASRIAVYPGVRKVLTGVWRAIGREGGVVLEGRDIGTMVFPDAELKFYLDARPAVRAERRFREEAGEPGASLERVARELARRDEIDREREHAPLALAPDAVEVDTSELTPGETASVLEKEARARLGGLGGRVRGGSNLT